MFLYRFADALEYGSRLQVYRSQMPEFPIRRVEVYG
jgi:hypothetical protein